MADSTPHIRQDGLAPAIQSAEVTSTPLLAIDGRELEGGGQLLRLAVGLSALKGTPIEISHIRGNRSAGGGLRSQHLACVKWLATACGAVVSGAERGSSKLVFRPGATNGNPPVYRKVARPGGRWVWEATLDIKTAGSTALGLQAILPFILFAPPRENNGLISQLPLYLTVCGGTNVSNSPSYDYIAQVLLPTLAAIGLPSMTPVLHERGWSHGGSSIGSFTLEIPARKTLALPAFSLYPANPTLSPIRPSRLQATFVAPAAMHASLRSALKVVIPHIFGPIYTTSSSALTVDCEDTRNPKHIYLLLVATMPISPNSPSGESSPSGDSYLLARDCLYERGFRRAEFDDFTYGLVTQVANELHREWASGAWVDEYMRDQLVVFRALAKGAGRVWGGWRGSGPWNDGEREERDPSLHAKTAEWIVREVLGHGKEDVSVVGSKEPGGADDDLSQGIAQLSLW